jgi:hypothetical protein
MSRPCARLWELEPYREGRLGEADRRSFERHLRTCALCTTQRRRDEHLLELARALPGEEPTELDLRRLRTRVLRDAAAGVVPPAGAGRGRRLAAASLAVAVGVAIAGWVLAAHRTPAPDATAIVATATAPATPPPSQAATPSLVEALAGAIVPSGAARWSQSRAEGVERVTLDEGTLHVHVRPQSPSERFLVALPDGELEVRGTTFEVTVDEGATTRVHVDEGVVEVRLRNRGTRRLGADESWTLTAPPVGTSAPHSSTPAAAPSPPAVIATDGATQYAAAMRLLGEGRNDEAASAFHAFAVSQPDASQAEDASFLEAVALARLGRGDAAALAAEHHLARYPASFHKREASILVARAAVHRAECDKARALLAPWLGLTPDPDALTTLRPCDAR